MTAGAVGITGKLMVEGVVRKSGMGAANPSIDARYVVFTITENQEGLGLPIVTSFVGTTHSVSARRMPYDTLEYLYAIDARERRLDRHPQDTG